MLSLHDFYKKINSEEGRIEITSAFSKLDENKPDQSDKFFNDFCVGLWIETKQKIPYFNREYTGRIDAYEDLLSLIKKYNSEKYSKIHKGTPYCLLGWLYFDIGDYEKGVFYIDLAILEDIRMHMGGWRSSPATRLLTLETFPQDVQMLVRIVEDIKNILQFEIAEYKSILTTSRLVSLDAFVKRALKNPHHRTIVASLYAFMLQQKSLQNMMALKGEESGSLEPFLIHLRKGTIILETMLKEIYSSLSGQTLHGILTDPFVMRDSGLRIIESGKVGSTLEDLVQVLIPHFNKSKESPQNKWMTISYRLRNVTSHGMPWSEIIDAETYKNLYRQILFSIFYLIDKKYNEK